MADQSEFRVVLVDDHPVVRAGLRAMLTQPSFTGGVGVSVVAEADSGEEALRTVQALTSAGEPLDVVLMDLQLGSGIDGVETTRRLKQSQPQLAVMILTTYDTEADILAAVEAGASGYMLKDAPAEQIHRAVADAAAGRTALAPEVAARLMDRVRQPSQSLSAREVELMQQLAAGYSNRDMARLLFISEATVKTHLVHIYQKLGVESRVGAVAEARRRRILRD